MRLPRSLITLSVGHFFLDNYSSMLGALLPFLHQKLGLSLSQAGILGGVLVFSSSLTQPFYGYLADRLRHRAFAALGPGVAGLFICSMGLAHSFPVLLALVFLGGVGIAAFHPQGAAVAAQGAGSSHGYQMSVFITSGMIGYSLGPVVITAVIALVGLERSYWAALPGLLVSAYLLGWGPSPSRAGRHARWRDVREKLLCHWRPLSILYSLTVVRSINQLVLVAFLPLYFTSRGFSEMASGQLLTLFLLAGGSAGFLGGVLADRFGGKTIILVSMLAYPPILLGFLLTSGIPSILLSMLGAAFLLLTTPVNLVMGQRLVPEAASTVSALMMGFAWGVGGFFVPLVGFLGDFYGIEAALVGLVLLTLPGFLPALWLPSRGAAGSSGRMEPSAGKMPA